MSDNEKDPPDPSGDSEKMAIFLEMLNKARAALGDDFVRNYVSQPTSAPQLDENSSESTDRPEAATLTTTSEDAENCSGCKSNSGIVEDFQGPSTDSPGSDSPGSDSPGPNSPGPNSPGPNSPGPLDGLSVPSVCLPVPDKEVPDDTISQTCDCSECDLNDEPGGIAKSKHKKKKKRSNDKKKRKRRRRSTRDTPEPPLIPTSIGTLSPCFVEIKTLPQEVWEKHGLKFGKVTPSGELDSVNRTRKDEDSEMRSEEDENAKMHSEEDENAKLHSEEDENAEIRSKEGEILETRCEDNEGPISRRDMEDQRVLSPPHEDNGPNASPRKRVRKASPQKSGTEKDAKENRPPALSADLPTSVSAQRERSSDTYNRGASVDRKKSSDSKPVLLDKVVEEKESQRLPEIAESVGTSEPLRKKKKVSKEEESREGGTIPKLPETSEAAAAPKPPRRKSEVSKGGNSSRTSRRVEESGSTVRSRPGPKSKKRPIDGPRESSSSLVTRKEESKPHKKESASEKTSHDEKKSHYEDTTSKLSTKSNSHSKSSKHRHGDKTESARSRTEGKTSDSRDQKSGGRSEEESGSKSSVNKQSHTKGKKSLTNLQKTVPGDAIRSLKAPPAKRSSIDSIISQLPLPPDFKIKRKPENKEKTSEGGDDGSPFREKPGTSSQQDVRPSPEFLVGREEAVPKIRPADKDNRQEEKESGTEAAGPVKESAVVNVRKEVPAPKVAEPDRRAAGPVKESAVVNVCKEVPAPKVAEPDRRAAGPVKESAVVNVRKEVPAPTVAEPDKRESVLKPVEELEKAKTTVVSSRANLPSTSDERTNAKIKKIYGLVKKKDYGVTELKVPVTWDETDALPSKSTKPGDPSKDEVTGMTQSSFKIDSQPSRNLGKVPPAQEGPSPSKSNVGTTDKASKPQEETPLNQNTEVANIRRATSAESNLNRLADTKLNPDTCKKRLYSEDKDVSAEETKTMTAPLGKVPELGQHPPSSKTRDEALLHSEGSSNKQATFAYSSVTPANLEFKVPFAAAPRRNVPNCKSIPSPPHTGFTHKDLLRGSTNESYYEQERVDVTVDEELDYEDDTIDGDFQDALSMFVDGSLYQDTEVNSPASDRNFSDDEDELLEVPVEDPDGKNSPEDYNDDKEDSPVYRPESPSDGEMDEGEEALEETKEVALSATASLVELCPIELAERDKRRRSVCLEESSNEDPPPKRLCTPSPAKHSETPRSDRFGGREDATSERKDTSNLEVRSPGRVLPPNTPTKDDPPVSVANSRGSASKLRVNQPLHPSMDSEDVWRGPPRVVGAAQECVRPPPERVSQQPESSMSNDSMPLSSRDPNLFEQTSSGNCNLPAPSRTFGPSVEQVCQRLQPISGDRDLSSKLTNLADHQILKDYCEEFLQTGNKLACSSTDVGKNLKRGCRKLHTCPKVPEKDFEKSLDLFRWSKEFRFWHTEEWRNFAFNFSKAHNPRYLLEMAEELWMHDRFSLEDRRHWMVIFRYIMWNLKNKRISTSIAFIFDHLLGVGNSTDEKLCKLLEIASVQVPKCPNWHFIEDIAQKRRSLPLEILRRVVDNTKEFPRIAKSIYNWLMNCDQPNLTTDIICGLAVCFSKIGNIGLVKNLEARFNGRIFPYGADVSVRHEPVTQPLPFNVHSVEPPRLAFVEQHPVASDQLRTTNRPIEVEERPRPEVAGDPGGRLEIQEGQLKTPGLITTPSSSKEPTSSHYETPQSTSTTMTPIPMVISSNSETSPTCASETWGDSALEDSPVQADSKEQKPSETKPKNKVTKTLLGKKGRLMDRSITELLLTRRFGALSTKLAARKNPTEIDEEKMYSEIVEGILKSDNSWEVVKGLLQGPSGLLEHASMRRAIADYMTANIRKQLTQDIFLAYELSRMALDKKIDIFSEPGAPKGELLTIVLDLHVRYDIKKAARFVIDNMRLFNDMEEDLRVSASTLMKNIFRNPLLTDLSIKLLENLSKYAWKQTMETPLTKTWNERKSYVSLLILMLLKRGHAMEAFQRYNWAKMFKINISNNTVRCLMISTTKPTDRSKLIANEDEYSTVRKPVQSGKICTYHFKDYWTIEEIQFCFEHILANMAESKRESADLCVSALEGGPITSPNEEEAEYTPSFDPRRSFTERVTLVLKNKLVTPLKPRITTEECASVTICHRDIEVWLHAYRDRMRKTTSGPLSEPHQRSNIKRVVAPGQNSLPPQRDGAPTTPSQPPQRDDTERITTPGPTSLPLQPTNTKPVTAPSLSSQEPQHNKIRVTPPGPPPQHNKIRRITPPSPPPQPRQRNNIQCIPPLNPPFQPHQRVTSPNPPLQPPQRSKIERVTPPNPPLQPPQRGNFERITAPDTSANNDDGSNAESRVQSGIPPNNEHRPRSAAPWGSRDNSSERFYPPNDERRPRSSASSRGSQYNSGERICPANDEQRSRSASFSRESQLNRADMNYSGNYEQRSHSAAYSQGSQPNWAVTQYPSNEPRGRPQRYQPSSAESSSSFGSSRREYLDELVARPAVCPQGPANSCSKSAEPSGLSRLPQVQYHSVPPLGYQNNNDAAQHGSSSEGFPHNSESLASARTTHGSQSYHGYRTNIPDTAYPPPILGNTGPPPRRERVSGGSYAPTSDSAPYSFDCMPEHRQSFHSNIFRDSNEPMRTSPSSRSPGVASYNSSLSRCRSNESIHKPGPLNHMPGPSSHRAGPSGSWPNGPIYKPGPSNHMPAPSSHTAVQSSPMSVTSRHTPVLSRHIPVQSSHLPVSSSHMPFLSQDHDLRAEQNYPSSHARENWTQNRRCGADQGLEQLSVWAKKDEDLRVIQRRSAPDAFQQGPHSLPNQYYGQEQIRNGRSGGFQGEDVFYRSRGSNILRPN